MSLSVGKYNIVSDRRGGQTTLSRRIVEDLLGLELPEYIVVHHIDMNKNNNSIDNLMLMYIEEHSSMHNSKNIEPVKCICHNCKKTFFLSPSEYSTRMKQIRPKNTLYCSKKCASALKKPPLNHHTAYPSDMNENIIRDWSNNLGIAQISRKHNWPVSAVGFRVRQLISQNVILPKQRKTFKLSENDVRDIYLSTESISVLSKKFNVCTETIRTIKQKKSHIKIIESFVAK